MDEQFIEEMLENANWAPTHLLTEPWRFVVFEGEGLKKLAEYQASRYKKTAEAAGDFSELTFKKLQTKPLMCSHMIAICMRRDPEERVPVMEEMAAVACAVQNMWLTATANGVGCYWSTGGVTYDEEAKSFFGLGAKDILMGFMNIGVPDSHDRNSRRSPIQDKVKWVRSYKEEVRIW